MTERFEISRRKALAALGTIGVASAGAGLGTSALFSDQETFEDNSITAGTLDMTVTATQVANSGEPYSGNLGLSATIGESPGDGDGVRLEATDVKPGDWVIYCFEIDVEDNPGYVTVHADNLIESGGDHPEPEQQVDGDNSGDLGAYTYVSHWGTFNGTTPSSPSNARSDLENLDSTTRADGGPIAQSSYGSDSGDETDMNGNLVLADDSSVEVTNLREFVDTYDAPSGGDGGVLIRNDDGNATNDPDPALEVGGSNTGLGSGTFTYYMLIEVPFDVGNEIQDDTVQFDLGWSTEQVRNNGDPRSGITFNNSST